MIASRYLDDYETGFSSLTRSTGVSSEANTIAKLVSDAVEHLFDTETLGERFRRAVHILKGVYEETRIYNWDGYGAEAVSGRAYYEAWKFLEALPILSVPIPEVSADPDGEISFEWYEGPDKIFSVSVSSDGQLAYAGIFGINKVYGSEYFDEEIPWAILDNLRRFTSHKE